MIKKITMLYLWILLIVEVGIILLIFSNVFSINPVEIQLPDILEKYIQTFSNDKFLFVSMIQWTTHTWCVLHLIDNMWMFNGGDELPTAFHRNGMMCIKCFLLFSFVDFIAKMLIVGPSLYWLNFESLPYLMGYLIHAIYLSQYGPINNPLLLNTQKLKNLLIDWITEKEECK